MRRCQALLKKIEASHRTVMSSKQLQSTPAADSFRMPGEFQAHAGCWMAWPHRPDIWRNGAKPVRQAFAQLVRSISRFEKVTLLVNETTRNDALERLKGVENVELFQCETDDAWLRDTGPTFVVKDDKEIRGVDWIFNAWGLDPEGNPSPWKQDDAVASHILDYLKIPSYRAPFILEGGSIHVDGEGTLITTEECLLNKNRNPSLNKDQIEELLRAYTGSTKILWLQHGVFGDEDTDGHIDNLCFFVRPGVVALTWTDDTSDPQHARSLDAYDRLTSATDARGRKLSVCKIHQPSPLFATKEERDGLVGLGLSQKRSGEPRMPASYINCYLANGAVIVPTFGDAVFDARAVADMQQLFPDREIVPVPSREFLLGGGNIHCLTQQQPALPSTS